VTTTAGDYGDATTMANGDATTTTDDNVTVAVLDMTSATMACKRKESIVTVGRQTSDFFLC
jgi:hypothetical protein